jgi:hypothetical protein
MYFRQTHFFVLGFFTVLLCAIWISLFTVILPKSSVGLNGILKASGSYQLRNSIANDMELLSQSFRFFGTSITETVSYQFRALWEAACFSSRGCISSLSLGNVLDGEMDRLPYQLATFQSMVLGGNTFLQNGFFSQGLDIWLLYVDRITFGLIGQIYPSLVQSCR